MCLNRFYLAQGVKLYSHETWRILFDRSEGYAGAGIESIAMNAGAVCRYYVKMADADNHVVREAACQAVAELANKVGRNKEYSDYLAPYVITLLQVSTSLNNMLLLIFLMDYRLRRTIADINIPPFLLLHCRLS
jgi:hypothetical protein